MLKLISTILFLVFSNKAYSFEVNIYKHECGIATLFVDKKYGISKANIEKYFDIYDFSMSTFWTCGDSDLLLSKNLKNTQFLAKLTNHVKIIKDELKIFDNFPSTLDELRPVINDKKRLTEFGIWLQEIRLEFFKTGDINVLRKSYLGVPPSKKILDIVDNITILKDDIEVCNVSYYEFHNAWISYYYDSVYEKLYSTKKMDEADMQNAWYNFEQKHNMHSEYQDDGCD
jgi:hypothetical protein